LRIDCFTSISLIIVNKSQHIIEQFFLMIIILSVVFIHLKLYAFYENNFVYVDDDDL